MEKALQKPGMEIIGITGNLTCASVNVLKSFTSSQWELHTVLQSLQCVKKRGLKYAEISH